MREAQADKGDDVKPAAGLSNKSYSYDFTPSEFILTGVIFIFVGTFPKVPFVSAVRRGLEPLTPCVTGTYSNQLN